MCPQMNNTLVSAREVNRDLAAVRLPSAICGPTGPRGRPRPRVQAARTRRWTTSPRLSGWKRSSLPAWQVVAPPVSVQHVPSGAVDGDGKAGKADENEAKTLPLAEYYRSECHPENSGQQVG